MQHDSLAGPHRLKASLNKSNYASLCGDRNPRNADQMTFCEMSFSLGIKEGDEGILIKVKLHSSSSLEEEETRQLRKRFRVRFEMTSNETSGVLERTPDW